MYDGGIGIFGQPDLPVSNVRIGNISVKECTTPLALENFMDVKFKNVQINGVMQPEEPSPVPGMKLRTMRCRNSKIPE